MTPNQNIKHILCGSVQNTFDEVLRRVLTMPAPSYKSMQWSGFIYFMSKMNVLCLPSIMAKQRAL